MKKNISFALNGEGTFEKNLLRTRSVLTTLAA